MNVAAIRAQYRAALGREGEAVTLMRPGLNGAPDVLSAPVLARVVGFRPDGQLYDLQQGQRMAIVLAEDVEASGFPSPFLPNRDCIVWTDRTDMIQAVDDATRRVAGVLVAYEMRLVGA